MSLQTIVIDILKICVLNNVLKIYEKIIIKRILMQITPKSKHRYSQNLFASVPNFKDVFWNILYAHKTFADQIACIIKYSFTRIRLKEFLWLELRGYYKQRISWKTLYKYERHPIIVFTNSETLHWKRIIELRTIILLNKHKDENENTSDEEKTLKNKVEICRLVYSN